MVDEYIRKKQVLKMRAEIIAVGSELTNGAKLNTNAQWLSLELAEIGIATNAHVTVYDDLETIVTALRRSAESADLLLITGGIGPTLDDVTREAVAALLGVPLVLHEPSLEHVKMMFARRNRPMPERNIQQAMFPAGSTPLPNPRGTAPGIWAEYQNPLTGHVCKIASLPGVPTEMKQMFRQQVVVRLQSGDCVIRRCRINCFGVGESQAEEILGDLTSRGRDPDVGITAHEGTITLRVTAEGASLEDCRSKIEKTKEAIINRLGSYVFGEEDEELEHAVVRLLTLRRASLSTAESGTGGLLAHRITGVKGFEAIYMGGVVVPTIAGKRDVLGVAPQMLEEHGPISAEVAKAMAEGCRRRMGTDFALAVTEWPEFDPDNPLSTAPASFVALAGPGFSQVEEVQHFGDPAIIKSRTAKVAMNLLRRYLIVG